MKNVSDLNTSVKPDLNKLSTKQRVPFPPQSTWRTHQQTSHSPPQTLIEDHGLPLHGNVTESGVKGNVTGSGVKATSQRRVASAS